MNKSLVPFLLAVALSLTLLAPGCGDDSGANADAAGAGADGAVAAGPDAGPGEDLDMKATDFECVLRWDKVRNFRITNKLGHLTEALAVANNTAGGGEYPVGTIIQIVPIEAMVKRKKGSNPVSNDWEYFVLDAKASGTTITKRGYDIAGLGGNCQACHSKAMPQFDFICETSHGCDPLQLGSDVLVNIQNNDARCP